ncbi:unnamed protein product, partial [Staurois parvus]
HLRAAAVNHWVPAGDYSLSPGDSRAFLTGRRTVCKQSSSPCQLVHTALHGCAQHSHAKQTQHRVKTAHS